MTNDGVMFTARAHLRRMRAARPWNVPTCARMLRFGTSFAMRSFISPAALLVNVTARISSGGTCFSMMSHAMRCVMTRVFPEPAPARMHTGPSRWVAATSCVGDRRFAQSTDTRRIYGRPAATSLENDDNDDNDGCQ